MVAVIDISNILNTSCLFLEGDCIGERRKERDEALLDDGMLLFEDEVVLDDGGVLL